MRSSVCLFVTEAMGLQASTQRLRCGAGQLVQGEFRPRVGLLISSLLQAWTMALSCGCLGRGCQGRLALPPATCW